MYEITKFCSLHVFFWLIETAIVNAFILCRINKPPQQQKKFRQRRFRRELIRGLVGDVRHVPKRKRESTNNDIRLDGKLHLIYHFDNRKFKDCIVCSVRTVARKRSVFYCKTCPDNPGICPGLCFEKYHTLVEYK